MNLSITQRVDNFTKLNPILENQKLSKHLYADSDKKDIIWELLPKSVSNQTTNSFDENYIHLLLYIRNFFKNMYIAVEGKDIVTQKSWDSSQSSSGLKGGGVMTIIRGDVLEKSAVNLSVVSGLKYPSSQQDTKKDHDYAGKPFVAAGVSVISHPKNPYAPIMHFNIRMIKVFGDNGVHQWIGGGADLTPMEQFDQDTVDFHDTLKNVCELHPDIANYDHFKKWADEYFYIPHRKEARGVGGIFFDFIPITSDLHTGLLSDLGQQVVHSYAKILSRRVELEYNNELVEKHHNWRGRYAEFNLIYDRGTRFGLMSGGNHEAIFCSLPPQVRW